MRGVLILLALSLARVATLEARGDEKPTHRQIAWRHAGADFPTEAILRGDADWKPGLQDRRSLSRAAKLLFDADGFLKPRGKDRELAQSITGSLLEVVDRSEQSSAEAYAQLAALAYQFEAREDALRHAASAVLLRPFDSRLHSNFGFYLEAAGRAAEAEVLYRRALELDRNNTAVYLGLLVTETARELPNWSRIHKLALNWNRRECDPGLRETSGALLEAVIVVVDNPEITSLSGDGIEEDAELLATLRETVRGMLPAPIRKPAGAKVSKQEAEKEKP